MDASPYFARHQADTDAHEFINFQVSDQKLKNKVWHEKSQFFVQDQLGCCYTCAFGARRDCMLHAQSNPLLCALDLYRTTNKNSYYFSGALNPFF